MLTELGGRFPAVQAASGQTALEKSTQLSAERLGDFADADALIVVANMVDGRDDFLPLQANPLWSTLPAVKANRVVRTQFWSNYGSVRTAEECVRLIDQAYGLLA